LKSRDGYKPCDSCYFTRSNCLIYIKSGYVVKKSGEIEKMMNKIGKIETFTVSIDTASTPI